MNKDIIFSIIAWVILATIAIAVIGFLGTAGIVILKIVGIEYQSLKYLIIFMVVLFLVSIPINLFVEPLPKALYTVGKIKRENIDLILYPLDFIGNMVAIKIADYFMESIKLSFMSACIFSMILCTINYLLDKKKCNI
ncbi:MAG: YrvL family regulatory protein [Thermacetogeniaceae bacterium]|jgi:hypothetical protein